MTQFMPFPKRKSDKTSKWVSYPIKYMGNAPRIKSCILFGLRPGSKEYFTVGVCPIRLPAPYWVYIWIAALSKWGRAIGALSTLASTSLHIKIASNMAECGGGWAACLPSGPSVCDTRRQGPHKYVRLSIRVHWNGNSALQRRKEGNTCSREWLTEWVNDWRTDERTNRWTDERTDWLTWWTRWWPDGLDKQPPCKPTNCIE